MRGITKAVLGVATAAALVAGALVADDVARNRVEARVLAEVDQALPRLVDPQVQVAGALVLPQLARGRLDAVTVTAAAVTVPDATFTGAADAAGPDAAGADGSAADAGDGGTTVTGLTATAHSVDLDLLVADRLEITGVVALAELAGRLPPGLGVQSNGGQVVLTTAVLDLPVRIPVDLTVADGAALVTVRAVSIAGLKIPVADLPGVLAEALSGLRLELPRVAGVAVTDVEVLPEGLRLTAVGTDVTLRAEPDG